MKIVFFGTPYYILPILKSLHKTFKSKSGESSIVACVTQKPKPAGRKKFLSYSPVDKWAHKHHIKVLHELDKLPEADVGILASYGKIIPKKVISHFPHGIVNIHPSLLPNFRGASPVQAVIISDKEVGVSIIKIDEIMDHGPILSQFKDELEVQDTTDILRKRLFKKSAEVLTTLLPAYIEGKIKLRKQEHNNATYTTLLKKAHGFIPPKYLTLALKGRVSKNKWRVGFIQDYTLTPTPYNLDLFIRAMQSWPVAWTEIKLSRNKKQETRRLKILKAHVEDEKLVLDEVQLEGKNPVSWKQFKQGHATVIFE